MAENSSARPGDTPERRLGTWIRWARLDRGWSQRELAKHLASRGLKMDPSGITRIEKGQRPIRVDEASIIAELFGVDISEMLTPVNFYAKAVEESAKLKSLIEAAQEQQAKISDLIAQIDDPISSQEEVAAARERFWKLRREIEQIKRDERRRDLDAWLRFDEDRQALLKVDEDTTVGIQFDYFSGFYFLTATILPSNIGKESFSHRLGPYDSLETAFDVFTALARYWRGTIHVSLHGIRDVIIKDQKTPLVGFSGSSLRQNQVPERTAEGPTEGQASPE